MATVNFLLLALGRLTGLTNSTQRQNGCLPNRPTWGSPLGGFLGRASPRLRFSHPQLAENPKPDLWIRTLCGHDFASARQVEQRNRVLQTPKLVDGWPDSFPAVFRPLSTLVGDEGRLRVVNEFSCYQPGSQGLEIHRTQASSTAGCCLGVS